MKNYKGTDSKMRCCGNIQFELGKRYSVKGKLAICKNGFHSCNNLHDVVIYYPLTCSRYFEVEVEDSIPGIDKNVSRHITFIRELSFYEVMRMLNFNIDGSPLTPEQENTNKGFFNCGMYNCGNQNKGNLNTGNANKGNGNTGAYNTGNHNRGVNILGHNNTGADIIGNGFKGVSIFNSVT